MPGMPYFEGKSTASYIGLLAGVLIQETNENGTVFSNLNNRNKKGSKINNIFGTGIVAITDTCAVNSGRCILPGIDMVKIRA